MMLVKVMSPQKSKLTTREERRQRGRLCRDKIRRVDQANWNPKDRKFDVIDLLLEAQHGRIPELLPD